MQIKQKQKVLSYIMFSLISFVALSFVLLSYTIPNSYAHENILNINVSGACTLTTGGGSYSVTMVDGSTEINANNITTSCNDTSGYAIYAVGYSGDSYTGNNTDLIHPTNSSYNIKTDGSSDTGSSWKLKFTVVSDATISGSYNTYQNIPSTYTKVASFSANTASGIITPHYQINLVGMQQPGTYTGQVKYVLVHPSTTSISTYDVSFNANGGTGSMTNATNNPTIEDYTLPTSTLTPPTGYSFNGWCTVQDTNQTPQTTCSGTTYDNEDTITADTVASGSTINLYAIWSANTYSLTITFAGVGVSNVKVCLVSGSCSGTNLKGTVSSSGGSVSGLVYNTAYYLYPSFSSGYILDSWSKTDSASGSSLSSTSVTNPTYTVGEGNGAVTITGKINTTTFVQAYASAGKSQTSGYYKMQDMTSSICSIVANGQSGTLRDIRGSGTNYTVAKIGNVCWMTKNLMLGTSSTMVLNQENSNVSPSGYTLPISSTNGFYGNADQNIYNAGDRSCSTSQSCYGYYSWAAATAGTNPSSGNASYDICPRGWRLPTRAELESLRSTYYTGAKLVASPFLGVYAGVYINSNSLDGGGWAGYYWSSTADGSNKAYRLYYGDSSSNTSSYNKYMGTSIRCVAKS